MVTWLTVLTDFCIKKYMDNLYLKKKKKVHLLAPKKQLNCVLPFLGKKLLLKSFSW